MTKLERLRMERKAVDRLALLPAQMRKMLEIFYKREITAIEQYGADNPEFKRSKKR